MNKVKPTQSKRILSKLLEPIKVNEFHRIRNLDNFSRVASPLASTRVTKKTFFCETDFYDKNTRLDDNIEPSNYSTFQKESDPTSPLYKNIKDNMMESNPFRDSYTQ